MKRGNRRDSVSKWVFTSNLRHDAILCVAVGESSDTVMWSEGGRDGLFLVRIPPSSLLRPTNLGIIYFCKMRIVKLVGERYSRTSGLELEPQPICRSRHPLNHTVNMDTFRPLRLKGL